MSDFSKRVTGARTVTITEVRSKKFDSVCKTSGRLVFCEYREKRVAEGFSENEGSVLCDYRA